jgi:cation transport regulator ChaB
MPHQNNSELPGTVKENLPEHRQDIYREAFNNAWEQYKEPYESREMNIRKKLLTKSLRVQLRKSTITSRNSEKLRKHISKYEKFGFKKA